MDVINAYLEKTMNIVDIHFTDGVRPYQDVRPHVKCKDGFTISVQAGTFYYSCPKFDGAIPYETVELGYPSSPDELIMAYAENPDEPCDTVYGYVPVDIVCQLVEKHGGIAD